MLPTTHLGEIQMDSLLVVHNKSYIICIYSSQQKWVHPLQFGKYLTVTFQTAVYEALACQKNLIE